MIKKEEINDNNNINLDKIVPWNSLEFPAKINNIRYNQDNSLFTLATSRGYKIFSTKNLMKVHEETETVRELGDLNIVMTYYSSSLVFFTPTENNENFSTKELILFDDFGQNKMSSFKSKKEKISNFFVAKSAIFIILESELLILELLSFKIINIIRNIYTEQKLCSFNVYGFVAFTKKNEKYNVYIKVLNIENNKIVSIRNRCIKPNFEYIQGLQLSPSGQLIALCSIFGNKIHIYYVENLILKECFYLGNEINDIIKMSFPAIGEGYLIFQINNKNFRLYRFSNILEGQFKCNCYKYKNEEMLKEMIKRKENEKGWINYFKKKYFNYYFYTPSPQDNNISNASISFEVNEGILFLDFVENDIFDKFKIIPTKEIVIINEKGYYYKYSFNNDEAKYINDNINLNLKESLQWV